MPSVTSATVLSTDEAELPPVPLPSLQESCAQFLLWCAPLLSAAEREETERAISSLVAPDSPAHRLQDELDACAHSDASWLDGFWRRRYLGRRDRIALNANFFYLFEDTGQSQLQRSVALVLAALDYKRRLDDGTLPEAVRRGQRLSTRQRDFLFSTTRIPQEDCDTLRSAHLDEDGPTTSGHARHIVVLCREQMFELDVLDAEGRPLPAADLAAALRSIQDLATVHSDAPPVGHLTTMARAAWASARQRLTAIDPVNERSLDGVETALFCLCLDDTNPADELEACRELLHGGGGNRWYDKALSFIVFANGAAGLNGEHSCLDGMAIVEFLDSVLPVAATMSYGEAAQTSASGTPFRGPRFQVDAAMRATIDQAGRDFAEAGRQANALLLYVDTFDAARAKRAGVSADAFLQMAYQLAHHRVRGFQAATYESIATRHWRHGRTEAMRVVTPESAAYVEAMSDPGASRQTRRALLQAALEAHGARVRQCQEGRAPEQHLWALQMRALEHGLADDPHLALFDSPGWRILRHDYLSTSASATASLRYSGFGATSADGIGVSYVMRPGGVGLHLSSGPGNRELIEGFARELLAAIPEQADLLEQS